MGIRASLTALHVVMDRRRLGPSDLLISRVGIGTAPIGSRPGEWWVNWDRRTTSTRCGPSTLRWTAASTGSTRLPSTGGSTPRRSSAAHFAGREGVLVFTKCGTLRRDGGDDFMDLSPDSIRRDCEQSLRRLGRERLDLLQFHDVDPNVPIEESWGALQELVAEGKVRHGGLSNHPPELVERALAVGPVAALQFQYSALARDHEQGLLPYAQEHELGVIVWSPLASGFLTDGFSLEALPPDFVLAHSAVTGAIVGIRNEREGRDLVAFA
jgi:aryl-alcohol dehydrogenase-like predicted oxidoreductase